MRLIVISCVWLLVIGAVPSVGLADDPRLCEVNFDTGRRTCGITLREAREIVRFVRTVRGIDRRVITIDALSPPDVKVDTGRWSDGYGDVVYLRRQHGRWIVTERLYWRDEGGITIVHK